MNRSLFILLLVWVQSSLLGQPLPQYQSFAIDQKEVAWVQVYHVDDSIEQVSQKFFDHLKHKVWISNIHWEQEEIIAELTSYKPDYKRYGGKYLNTSSVSRTGRWKGKVRISFKEGKYRVIVTGLNYEARQSSTGSGKATIEQHSVSGTIEEWSLSNYRTVFRKNRRKDLDILHFSFKDSFTLTFNQLIDSEW